MHSKHICVHDIPGYICSSSVFYAYTMSCMLKMHKSSWNDEFISNEY